MGESDIAVELGDDHVAVVEIRRPPENYFDVGLITGLAEVCEELAAGAWQAGASSRIAISRGAAAQGTSPVKPTGGPDDRTVC